jgi:hypothetical protein
MYEERFIPQTGRTGRHAHELPDGDGLGSSPVRAWAHMEDATYLAIEFCSRVHTDHGKYGSYESGQTRNGIDLPKGGDKIKALGRATRPNSQYKPISSSGRVDALG